MAKVVLHMNRLNACVFMCFALLYSQQHVNAARPHCTSTSCEEQSSSLSVAKADCGDKAGSGPIRTPQQLQTTLALAATWFQKADIPFFVVQGTALQLYRNGGLVRHDDDVDILIWHEDINRVESMLVDEGYFRHFEAVPMMQIGTIPNGAPLDIYVDTGAPDIVCNTWDNIAFPRNLFEPAQERTYEVNGEMFTFRFVAQPEKYLAMAYGGDSWKVPRDVKGPSTSKTSAARRLFWQNCTDMGKPGGATPLFKYQQHVRDVIRRGTVLWHRGGAANVAWHIWQQTSFKMFKREALIGGACLSVFAIVFVVHRLMLLSSIRKSEKHQKIPKK